MPVKQSSSKEEFLKALGLNAADPQDKERLQQMWEEVTTFWMHNFETTSRDILKREYAANLSVMRPYKWAHLDPAIIDSAITRIWSAASPWPRVFYDRGASDDRKIYNWVLKWLLWHVCRYRDWRNRKSRPPTQVEAQMASSSSVVTAAAAREPRGPWS